MKSSSKKFAASLLALFSMNLVCAAQAQISESGRSSASSTVTEETIKGYAFKYKQRFDNYAEQIDMGVNKGWLTSEQAETFKKRLTELRGVESTAAKANYPDDQIANLDKMTTKFNEDLSSASSTKSTATAAGEGSKQAETK